MQIKNKRALILGASSGLGVAFSKELLRNGAARVLMVDVDQPTAQVQAERLNGEFGQERVSFVSCRSTRGPDLDGCLKEAVRTLGGLDIVVNCVALIDEVDFQRAIETNVTAVFRASMMAIQQMGKDAGSRGGVIVNVASVLGLEAFPNLPVFSSINHAVISFSRSFSQPYHYQRTGVRVIVLCPGLTESPILENLKSKTFVPQPEELAEAMQLLRPQRVENVAHALVYVIRCAHNGSVWITENGQPVYEIQLPNTLPSKDDY